MNRKFFGILASAIITVGAVYAAVTTMGLDEYRPAMAYEVKQEIEKLTKQQLDLRIDQLRMMRRDTRQEKLINKRVEQEYREQNKPVPDWILKQQADVDEELQQIEEELQRVQRQRIDLQ